MNQDPYYQETLAVARENALVRAVYNWMMIGLLVSGLTAYFSSNSPFILNLVFGNSFVLILLVIAELGMVFAISGGAKNMTASTATTMFLLFSFINGLTLAVIFLAYTYQSIAATFMVTGVTFGATSLYGYVTKRDLASLGGYLFMALIGLIVASIVNIFLHSTMLGWIVTYTGILIFVGLTAYDTQKIKRLGETITPADGERYGRLAIVGALMLYLDFINLFLLLLRIFGGRRN